MADLTLITVDPYHVDEMNEQEFKHHYKLGETLLKAGDPIDWRAWLTKTEDVNKIESLLGELTKFYEPDGEHDKLMEQLEAIEVEIGEIEKENQRNRADLTAKLKENAQDVRVYFRFIHMEATMLDLDARRKLVLAQLSKPSVWTASAIKLIHAAMRALLPMVGSKDGKFFVWHAPDDVKKMKPDMLRDFPIILEQLLGKDALYQMIQTRRALMQPQTAPIPGMIRG